MFKQESAEITKGGDRDLGLAKGQCCAGGGIQHPRRHDDAGALLALDEDYIGPTSPLGIKQSDGTTMESVPPIVDGHFLSDTGRITPRWPWAENHGSSPAQRAWLSAPAIMYTLIQTAKLNDIDSQAWLADSLSKIADTPQTRLGKLLPWNWMSDRLPRAA